MRTDTMRKALILAFAAILAAIGIAFATQAHAALSYTITYDANEIGSFDEAGTEKTMTQPKASGDTVKITDTKPISQSDVAAKTVKLDSNGGKVEGDKAEITVKGAVTYTFDKWNTKADGTGDDFTAGQDYSENADLMLYAKWTQVQGEAESLPLATQDGFKFLGWFSEKDGGELVGAVGDRVADTFEGDTVYAHWEAIPKTFIVAFDGNGATSGAMGTMTVECGSNFTLPANAFVRDGYTFAGWSTSATTPAGEATLYKDGATLESTGIQENTTVTLYAIWAQKEKLSPTGDASTALLVAGMIAIVAVGALAYRRKQG